MKLEDLETAGQASTDYRGILARYLFNFANGDEHFKQKLIETDKTLDGCINYIKSEARKQAVSGCAVVEDDVVWHQAIHYFLEDSINNEVKSKPKPTPQEIDLNEQEEASNIEDEQEVKEEAKPRKTVKKAQKTAQDEQPSIFDFEF